MRCPHMHRYVLAAKSQNLSLCQMALTSFGRLRKNLFSLQNFRSTSTPSQPKLALLSMAALVVLYCTQPFTTPTLPNNSCLRQPQNWDLPHSKLGSSVYRLSLSSLAATLLSCLFFFNSSLHRPLLSRLHVCTLETSVSSSETKFVTCVEPIWSHTAAADH